MQWGQPLGDPQQEAGGQAPDPPQVNPAGDRVAQWAGAEVEAVRVEVGLGVGVGVQLHPLGVGAGLSHPPWYDHDPCLSVHSYTALGTVVIAICLLP